MSTIGRKIIEFRKIAKHTQGDLAGMLGISARQLIRYEKGELIPNAGIIAQLSKIYKINFQAIADGKKVDPPAHDPAIEHLQKTNAQLIKIIRDHFETIDQQTIKEIVGTLNSHRLLLIHLATSPNQPVFSTKEDVEDFLNTMAKRSIRALPIPGNKDRTPK